MSKCGRNARWQLGVVPSALLACGEEWGKCKGHAMSLAPLLSPVGAPRVSGGLLFGSCQSLGSQGTDRAHTERARSISLEQGNEEEKCEFWAVGCAGKAR